MKTINILLIEDNPQDARLMIEMLKDIKSFNCKLVSSNTLKDGCAQMQKNNLDILLLDLNLPDSTGRQTFQKVIDCNKEIPVVLITGNEDEELSLSLIKDGAQDYFIKQNLNSYILGKSILYSIERKRSEMALKESRKLLDEAHKMAHIGLWSWEADMDIVSWSEELYQIAGLDSKFPPPSYAEHKNVYTPQSWDIMKIAVEKAMKTGEGYQLELELIRPDGNKRNVMAFGGAKSDNMGRFIGLFGTVQDITDPKQAKEKLIIANKELLFQYEEKEKQAAELIIAKEHAEESDRLKTAFLHNISHEIRTPMNAIVGFSGFLNDPDLEPEKRQHFIDIIVQSSDQLLSIISDIVSISTIEAGQERIIEKELELNATLVLLHEQFLLKANKQTVCLTLQPILPEREIWIKTDETKLVQVLTNLIGNALKFTKQGYINFGYKIVETEHAPSLQFFVEDTGLGIPPEMHKEIFKRFRQVEISVTRQFGGSGLGLSISQAYVELLGGKMWVESELGKGSTFYFTIPYIRLQKNTLAEKQFNNQLKIEIYGPKTILVAEDDDSNFKLVEELLSGLNFNIIRVINGLEAVETCKSNKHIDLVLMDIKMPVMDGYDATKQIKSFMPNLPIIAQTAYATDIDRNKALVCGCTDYISKPIKHEALLAMINKQLFMQGERI